MNELPGSIDSLEPRQLRELVAQVVTVCNLGGPRSFNAAAQLKDMGYENAAPLRGGVVGWDGD